MLLARLRLGLPTASRALLDQADLALRNLIDQVGALSLDLRPALLDEFGLTPALWWYRERVRSQTGIQVALTIDGLSDRVDREVELAAYRIVQEALTITSTRGAGTAITAILPRPRWGKKTVKTQEPHG